MENLHYLFNKGFYENLTVKDNKLAIPDISKKIQRLYGAVFAENDYEKSPVAKQTFLMKTVYPGFITGSGNVHGVSVDDDIKIGFTFDFVTGQPYIPGSSVKGVLKAYFSKPGVVNSLTGSSFSESQIKAFTKDIFENEAPDNIFLDAVIKHGDENGKLISGDYVTNHPSHVSAPNPIQFVKVLPDVVFEFRFILNDSVIDGTTLTAEAKTELFKKLLSFFGAGAKTNVGYGVLIPVSEDEDKKYHFPKVHLKNEKENKAPDTSVTNTATKMPATDTVIKVGAKVSCEITSIKNFGAFAQIIGTNRTGLIHISQITNAFIQSVDEYLSVGDTVTAVITKIDNKGIGLSVKQANK